MINFQKKYLCFLLFILVYSLSYNFTLAEIVLPQSQLSKTFSSFADKNKYDVKLGVSIYSGTANSAGGLNVNLYNNMTNKIAPMLSFDVRYNFFNTSNSLSRLKQTIDAGTNTYDILSHNLKISPRMDFLFKLGIKIKLNKDFSITPYGIVGANWSKLEMSDNIVIKQEQEQNNDNQIHGTKIMTLRDYLTYFNDYQQSYGEHLFSNFYFFDYDYNYNENDITNKINFNDMENPTYVDIFENTYSIYLPENLLKDNFKEDGYIFYNSQEEYLNYIKDKNNTELEQLVFIRNNNFDFDQRNVRVEYKDAEIGEILTYYEKDEMKIYQSKTCDEHGQCTITFSQNDDNSNKNITISNETTTPDIYNKWIGKYGAGIELMYKDRVSFKIEYLYSNVDAITRTIKHKMHIHEMIFGIGVYVV